MGGYLHNVSILTSILVKSKYFFTNKEVKTDMAYIALHPNTIKEYFTPILLGLMIIYNEKQQYHVLHVR